MPPARFVPGSTVRVKRHEKRLPAVILDAMPATSLVWVRVDGEEPSLIDTREITLRPATAGDDSLIWDTEVFNEAELIETLRQAGQ